MSETVAIIIPAYKPDYIIECLDSIFSQTSLDFNLYVGDDASPHNIYQLLQSHQYLDRLHYKRFDENLGGSSLVKHWERCVSMTDGEPWVWMFSDDDLMDPHCLESFKEALQAAPGYDVYKFASSKIDRQGNVLRRNKFPDVMSTEEFLNIRLRAQEESYMVEYIFSRKAYKMVGGFPQLPLAWAADDLFWSKISMKTGIKSINDAQVFWRYSGDNISSDKGSSTASLKMQACYQFIEWIYGQKRVLHSLENNNLPIKWFLHQLGTLKNSLSAVEVWRIIGKAWRFDSIIHFRAISYLIDTRITRWVRKYL
ncbi:MAG: glycosyltransferase family 2 protein [Imperialibacter sp.]|uniref:glycosyltransferase family 2 protein n=1 Tax=Imperialibacter sp. TaxID=2038411 RepID=UPI0032EBA94D